MAERYGLELFLKSNVKEVLHVAGESAKGMRFAINAAGSAAASSFKIAGASIVVFNQGLELAKKGLEVFKATIGESLSAAMQFRKEGDALTATFETYSKEIQLVKARLGDALMPVFKGFIDAIGEATGSISGLIATNSKLIGSTLIDWIGTVAKMLVTGIARSAEFVGKAFLGWQAVIQAVKAAINTFFEFLLAGFATAIGGIANVADAFGAGGMAKAIRANQAEIAALGNEFETSADSAIAAMGETSSSIGALESRIASMTKTANDLIGKGMANAQREVRNATIGTTTSIEEQRAAIQRATEAAKAQTDALAKASKHIDEFVKRRADAIDEAADRFEADARLQDAAIQQRQSEQGNQIAGAALSSMGPLGGIASGFMQGGVVGGIAATVGAWLNESEGFQEALGVAGKVFSDLVQVLEPLMPIITLLVELMRNVLKPVFDGLNDVIMVVSKGLLWVVEGIAKVWNGIVRAISGILKRIGQISVFGKKPLGKLEEWGRQLERSASISTEAFDRARQRMDGTYNATAENMRAGADVIKGTVEDMQRQLINVPRVLKVALNEFRAADPAKRTMSIYSESQTSVAAARVQLGDAYSASRVGPQIIVDNVHVSTLADPRELAAQIQAEAAITGRARLGALAGARTMTPALAGIADF